MIGLAVSPSFSFHALGLTVRASTSLAFLILLPLSVGAPRGTPILGVPSASSLS
jgi:hypothetical protein